MARMLTVAFVALASSACAFAPLNSAAVGQAPSAPCVHEGGRRKTVARLVPFEDAELYSRRLPISSAYAGGSNMGLLHPSTMALLTQHAASSAVFREDAVMADFLRDFNASPFDAMKHLSNSHVTSSLVKMMAAINTAPSGGPVSR